MLEDAQDSVTELSWNSADNHPLYKDDGYLLSNVEGNLYAGLPSIAMMPPIIIPQAFEMEFETMDDTQLYQKSKTIPRLLKRIDETEENHCRDALRLLNWDEYRLKQRRVGFVERVKVVKNVASAKRFLNQVVSIYRKKGKTMKSSDLKRIEEAVYISPLLGESIYIPPTTQVTGRAVEAQNTLDPTKSSVEYFNPIFLFRNMLDLADALELVCPNRKIDLIDRLSRAWICGEHVDRARIGKELERILGFISISAPVTPEHIVLTSQVLFRVKNGNGKPPEISGIND